MSSLKSGALLSLFSGFSLDTIQRAAQKRETTSYDQYPSPLEIAYAARFSGPAQVSVTKVAAANSNNALNTRDAA
jgi:hypothetical protein